MRTAVETLVDAAMTITGADAAAIWLAAEAPSRQLQALKLAAARNIQKDALTAPSGKSSKRCWLKVVASAPPGWAPSSLCCRDRLGSVEQPQGILQLHTRSHSHFSTEQRMQAQTLAELGAVAIAAERTAAECAQLEARQTQFIHLTTHELRSPIAVAQTLVRNVVKGYAGALTDKQNHIFTAHLGSTGRARRVGQRLTRFGGQHGRAGAPRKAP